RGQHQRDERERQPEIRCTLRISNHCLLIRSSGSSLLSTPPHAMKPFALALIVALPMIAAASPNKAMQPSVAEAPFGVLEDGGKVSLYTLVNASGAEVRIINYGAIVVSLKVPDRA